jgi:hypothetical protein
MNRMHHPKADVDRMYVSRKDGGRGMTQLENSYKVSTVGLETYLKESHDHLLQKVFQHEKSKKLYSVHKEAEKFKLESGTEDLIPKENESLTEKAKRLKEKFKDNLQEQLQSRWESKPLHGQYIARINKADVDKQKRHTWLRGTGLKSETEGLITAAQDQTLATRYYEKKIIGKNINIKCTANTTKQSTT